MIRPTISMVKPEELQQMHWNKSMSIAKIAKVIGVSSFTIRTRMKDYGIKSRTRSESALMCMSKPSEKELQRMYYNESMSTYKIAEKIGVSPSTVYNWMKTCKIKLRTQSETKSMENHPNWNGGISFEPYCNKFNNIFKEAVRERDDYTCQLCGCEQLLGGRKLDVHHIRYDKENCYPDVVALCRSCNTKVNNNRNYWEDFFEIHLSERGLLNWSMGV